MMNDKQTQAVMFNLKEQRCLEKRMMTLSLEQSYSLSLININHKVVKVNYKRLKDRVSKIRSNLTADEINQNKLLEDSGKIPETAKKTEFDSRISVASKRLKLWPTGRAQSATHIGSISRYEFGSNDTNSRPSSAFVVRRNNESFSAETSRCKSSLEVRSPSVKPRLGSASETKANPNITTRPPGNVKRDAFISTAEQDKRSRIKSVEFSVNIENKKANIFHNLDKDPKSILKREATTKVNTCSDKDNRRVKEVEQLTEFTENTQTTTEDKSVVTTEVTPVPCTNSDPNSDGILAETDISTENTKRTENTQAKGTATAIQRANAAKEKAIADLRRASRLMAEGKTSVPFDSHSPEANDITNTKETPFRSIREGHMYGIGQATLDFNMGGELHKEIKKGLLLGEVANSLYLEDKIDTYIDKVETDLEATRREQNETEAKLIVERENRTKGKPVRNLIRRRQLKLRLRCSLDKPRIGGWDDMIKCRYLRLPDGTLDMSGISTLAADHNKLLEHMKMVGYEVIEPAS